MKKILPIDLSLSFLKVSLLVGFIIFQGCDVFSAREAEAPSDQGSNIISATTPELLVQNLQSSLSDKNTVNYVRNFTDSTYSNRKYVFEPTVESSIRYPSLLHSWGIVEEETSLKNVITRLTPDKSIKLDLTNEQYTYLGDSVFYQAKYSLYVPHQDANNPVVFQGNMLIKMIRDTRSVYTIYYWRDTQLNVYPSWSELKGLYY